MMTFFSRFWPPWPSCLMNLNVCCSQNDVLNFWSSECLQSQYRYCQGFSFAGVDDIQYPFPNETIWIFCKSHDIWTWDLHRDLHRDLARREWGLNPWSSVYETNALPLGHHATWVRLCALHKIFNFSYSMRFHLPSFTLLLLYRPSLAESDGINCPFPIVIIWTFCISPDISSRTC